MVKRFKVKFIYESSEEITEDDIRKNLNLRIYVFDTVRVLSIDEI